MPELSAEEPKPISPLEALLQSRKCRLTDEEVEQKAFLVKKFNKDVRENFQGLGFGLPYPGIRAGLMAHFACEVGAQGWILDMQVLDGRTMTAVDMIKKDMPLDWVVRFDPDWRHPENHKDQSRVVLAGPQ